MTTDTLSLQAVQESTDRAQAEPMEQYTLWQILGIWAVVSLPMAVMIWVVLPLIIPYVPLNPGIVYWLLIIAGMFWEFLVSLVIIYRELGTLRWSAVRRRIWLQTPRDPGTDRPNSEAVLVACASHPRRWSVGYGDWRVSRCALAPAVSCTARCPVHGYESIGCPRIQGRVVAPGSGPGQQYLQLFPGRGIPLARRTAAQDARGFWKVRLGGKRRSFRFLSPPQTMGAPQHHPDEHDVQLASRAFSQHLDGDRRARCGRAAASDYGLGDHPGVGRRLGGGALPWKLTPDGMSRNRRAQPGFEAVI